MSARLLIVDADEELRASVETILRRAGHAVHTAASGSAALERLAGHEYAVAIVDADLPDTDGATFTGRARTLQPDLEVLLLAAPAEARLADAATTNGAYDVVSRPFKRVDLERAVARALEHRSLAIENQRLRAQVETQAPRRPASQQADPAWRQARLLAEQATTSVRQLERAILEACAAAHGQGDVDEPRPEPMTLSGSSSETPGIDATINVPVGTPLDEVERLLIRETLRLTGGNKQRAATLLGIATRTIYRKLEQ